MKLLRFAFLLLLFPLTGCDLMLASQAMPGLIWPIGKPITGLVTDADTGLPLGKATIVCGMGVTQSDNTGHFSLYGALSADSISASRTGYGSLTYKGTGTVKDGQNFALNPLFPNTGDLAARYARISGQTTLRGAGVMFSDRTAAEVGSDGRFLLDLKAALPGSVYSGVLANGVLSGGPIEDGKSPFFFSSFGFDFLDVPFADSPALSEAAPFQLTSSAPSAIMDSLSISYSNLGGLTNALTEVALDFGMRGDILVARQVSSTAQIKIPSRIGMVYALTGTAFNSDSSLSSKVSITTNSLGGAVSLDLLPIPKPIFPTGGKSGVGGQPTFLWNAVPNATYVVKVFEAGDARARWIGYTDSNSITFPAFPDGDLNGGSLAPSTKYTWSVLAVSSGAGKTTVGSAGVAVSGLESPPTKPFRQTQRESAASNDGAGSMEFQR